LGGRISKNRSFGKTESVLPKHFCFAKTLFCVLALQIQNNLYSHSVYLQVTSSYITLKPLPSTKVGSGERRYCTGNGDAAAANDDNIAREMFSATMKINDDDEIIALAPPALQKT